MTSVNPALLDALFAFKSRLTNLILRRNPKMRNQKSDCASCSDTKRTSCDHEKTFYLSLSGLKILFHSDAQVTPSGGRSNKSPSVGGRWWRGGTRHFLALFIDPPPPPFLHLRNIAAHTRTYKIGYLPLLPRGSNLLSTPPQLSPDHYLLKISTQFSISLYITK